MWNINEGSLAGLKGIRETGWSSCDDEEFYEAEEWK